MKSIYTFFVFFLPTAILAQTPTPIPQVIENLNKVEGGIDKVTMWVLASLPVVLGVIDFLVRKFPTKNPTSLLILVSGVLKAVIKILEKLDGFVGLFIPQNVKPPEPPKV